MALTLAFSEIEPRHSINADGPDNLMIEKVVVALMHEPPPQHDLP
jgi:hypothetical protein